MTLKKLFQYAFVSVHKLAQNISRLLFTVFKAHPLAQPRLRSRPESTRQRRVYRRAAKATRIKATRH